MIVDFAQWGCTLSRYLHLNPVRLRRLGLGKTDRAGEHFGLGEQPEARVVAARRAALLEHRWSAFGAYCTAEKGPRWLHTQEILACFGSRPRSAYRSYVEEAVGPPASPWSEMTAGFILGGADLVKRVAATLKADRHRSAAAAAAHTR